MGLGRGGQVLQPRLQSDRGELKYAHARELEQLAHRFNRTGGN